MHLSLGIWDRIPVQWTTNFTPWIYLNSQSQEKSGEFSVTLAQIHIYYFNPDSDSKLAVIYAAFAFGGKLFLRCVRFKVEVCENYMKEGDSQK